ncbi:hypothetical protein AB6831_04365 [Carnobacterium divergens]
MDNKADLVINQLAQNFAQKIAQLEGEKAILQVEYQELQKQNKELTEQK